MKISVFTGPVFQDNDPVYFGVKVPSLFWKVIVFIHDQTGQLTATGYKMSQKDFLPGEEFVFGQYETYQTSLKDIETMTQLSFGTLKSKDPLQVAEEAVARPLFAFEGVRFVSQ